jgi:hypothetical protein
MNMLDSKNKMQSIAELKEYLLYLKASRNTRYGSLGEKIFCHHMSKSHKVEKLHKHGADFLIDGKDRVDVKTPLMLDKKFGTTFTKISKKQQAPNTAYAYVLLLDDIVSIYLAQYLREPVHIANISWEDALVIFNTENIKVIAPKNLTTEQLFADSVIDDLEDWLAIQFHKKAKFVTRHNKKTQDSMCKSGWGPEAFFHDPKQNRGNVDLVVLIFFDGGKVYDIFSYPISEHSEIHFTDKKVGLNLSKRKTFAPDLLSNRYKFKSIAQFKNEVGNRFFNPS